MKSWLLCAIACMTLATACAQSDAGITTSVKSQFAADDLVKASQIDVDTQNHIVTLSGEVQSAEEKKQALDIARQTRGVSDVVDQLTVASEPLTPPSDVATLEPDASPASDATITATVKSQLLADPDTSGLRIDVDTEDRTVTLSGKVKSDAEKSEAVEIARKVAGVRDVTDRLTVERRPGE
jgi:hyperosmotically inducible periplasmic protein